MIRSRLNCCIWLFYLLYLHKNVSTFMSISLIYNNYYAQFVSVHFLIQENVTLGLMFAVCHKRDSKSIFFANNNPYIWSHKRYCHDHSRRFGIEQWVYDKVETPGSSIQALQLLKLGNRRIKTTKKLSLWLNMAWMFFCCLFCFA